MTFSRSACIDWNNIDEIIAHQYTVMEVLGMHPKLYNKVFSQNDSKSAPAQVLAALENRYRADAKSLLQEWKTEKLFYLRDDRWCKRCRAAGHTFTSCRSDLQIKIENAGSDSRSKQPEHTQKPPLPVGEPLSAKPETHHSKKRAAKKMKPNAKRARRFLKDFNYDSFLYEIERDRDGLCRMRMDAFHEGEVTRVDPEGGLNRGAFITAPAMQRSLWFSVAGNQIGFGLKRVQPGEKVWFRLKQNEEKHFCAVQVSPVDQSLDDTDIGRFLRWCDSTTDVCALMSLILASHKQWTEIIHFIRTRKEARRFLGQILKFIAHVSVLASSSIIDKSDAEWFKSIAQGKNAKEGPVYVPAFLRSSGMVRSYAIFFMQRVFQFGRIGERMPGQSVQTSPNSVLEIIREMVFQDLIMQQGDMQSLSDAGKAFFPPESRSSNLTPCALGNGEMVLILKIILGLCVLQQCTPQTKALVNYIMQLIGRSLSARKDPKVVTMFVPLLQSIHVALACVDKLLTASFHAIAALPKQTEQSAAVILQGASNGIALRAEELNYPLTDVRSPFHMQNIADLGKKQVTLYNHFHAHYITLRSEFYIQLARVMRSCMIGDTLCPQVQEEFVSKEPDCGEKPVAEPIKESKDPFAGDVVHDVRLIGLYMDHNNSVCPLFTFSRKGKRFSHEAFTTGALLTFVTGLNSASLFDASELFALSVVDSVSIEDQVILSVRAVEENFPWSVFIEKIRRNEGSAVSPDNQSKPSFGTCIFVQQSFFPAFEPVLSKIHEFLRLPFTHIPFPYLFGGNEPRKAKLIPNGYNKAFDYIIDTLHARYRLDSGQSDVMRALKSEPVLLVQGPPGTGKSFVGTRIVEAFIDFRIQLKKHMLSNLYEVGDTIETGTPRIGPILILTFKNHALDEFLKDILSTGLWCDGARGHSACACTGDHRGCCPKCCRHDKRVVRIGTRICDQTLLQHTLGELMTGVEKQQPYIDALKRFCLIKERIRSIFQSLSAMKAGSIPTGLFLRYLTSCQRESFVEECDGISGSVDVKESLIDSHGDDILVNEGTSMDFQRWLRGEENKATLDMSLNGRCTKESIQALIRDIGNGHQGDICEKLFQKDILALNSGKTSIIGEVDERKAKLTDVEAEADFDNRWSAFLDGGLSDGVAGESYFESMYAFDTTGFTFDFQKVLAEMDSGQPAAESNPPSLSVICPWVLSTEERHEFVASIIAHEFHTKATELAELSREYQNLRAFTKRVRQEDEIGILQRADVIAATSTGCTMHIELIKHIAPSVLIVEEAAEMLEAHLLSCLTPSMKQIILIGDHQQLRPRIDNYDLIANHHINISLFERLAREKYPLIMLNNQRRMQKEIADLIRPFYAREGYTLADHESITHSAMVSTNGEKLTKPPGFPSRVCFWDHEFPEKKLAHGHSLVNEAEIAMTVYLVNFTLFQGVHPSSITIITPYAAQRREVINALRRHKTCGAYPIAVTTVDRFQGDENDVIILSLVRTQNLTDFLQLENRMIVSCSRARHQLVVLGSKKLLSKCAHWRTVLKIFGSGNIHRSLPLYCVRHPKKIQRIATSDVQAAMQKAVADGERMPSFECKGQCAVENCDRDRCPGSCHTPFAMNK